MLEFFRQLGLGIRDAWLHLSINARVQIGVTAFLSFALIAGIVTLSSRPQYQRLFSRLDPTEASDIATWLAEQEIPYQLKDGGQTIYVPVQHVTTARVGLVDLGLPKSQGVSEGFELFTNRDLMTNQWLQNVDFMRAVQGEAQRQLNRFDFVRQSAVFIREAPEQLFVSEQIPSEAVVTLEVTRSLSPQEVKAVLHTISSFGGPNLNRKNITIALTDGTLLISPVEDEFASLASDQLEVQVARESEREQKIQRALKSMGRNSVVRVSAVMNWSDEEIVQRTVTEGAPVSTSSITTESTSQEGPPGGAPGARANIPAGLSGGTATGTTDTSEDLIENFDNSETLTTTTNHPGSVQTIRVAAFIEGDLNPVLDADGNQTGTEYVPLSAQRITEYKDFIASTVGEGVLASDVVVYDHPFDVSALTVGQAAVVPAGAWYQSRVVQLVGQGLLILLAFLLIRIFMRRALVVPTTEEEEVVEIPEATKEDMRRMEVAAEVERLSRDEPDAVASLLRSWLTEEED